MADYVMRLIQSGKRSSLLKINNKSRQTLGATITSPVRAFRDWSRAHFSLSKRLIKKSHWQFDGSLMDSRLWQYPTCQERINCTPCQWSPLNGECIKPRMKAQKAGENEGREMKLGSSDALFITTIWEPDSSVARSSWTITVGRYQSVLNQSDSLAS